MSYKIRFEENTGLVCLDNEDYVSLDEFKSQVEESILCMKEHTSRFLLIDNSYLKTSVKYLDIYNLLDFYDQLQLPKDSIIAVVTTTNKYCDRDIQFYEMLCINRGFNIKLFPDNDSARNWLHETALKKKSYVRGLIEILLGPVEHFSLQNMAFNAATFCSAATAFLLFFWDLFQGIRPITYLFSFSIAFIHSLFYISGRKFGIYNRLIWPFIITCYTIIIFDWMFIGGITGASLLISLTFVAIVSLLITGRQKYAILSGLLCIVTAMFLMEWMAPETVKYYDDRLKHLSDLFVTVLFLGVGISIMVSLVVYSYLQQQTKIQSLNQSLETMNHIMAERNIELEMVLQEIKTLRGIVPICSYCKNIRNDEGYFEAVEAYVERHSEADFSHTLCPDCLAIHYPDIYQEMIEEKK